ncbi:Oocyte-expressed protein-like protein [Camelus dromedarius]|uniref:Oocyte-expressed protein-like protein n=1 Tax=Camelus dromedarius TaxID=9838 RepID=A0A5N4C4G1_CAMDR|nr:oocyte-expressed protein homolog [Camelus dromedarius]KAB1253773.1 Oocyte-expressed protein-like protein [Camelus dromedarius]
MGDPGEAVQAQEGERTAPAQGDGLLMLPPRVLVRPWWFPAEDLENPLVFYLEAWLADQIFGPELEILPEIQWMSQALLSVNTVKSGTFVEIRVFGRPRVQLHVKSVILSLALRHKEHRAAGLRFKASTLRNDVDSTPCPPTPVKEYFETASVFPYTPEKMEHFKKFLKARAADPQPSWCPAAEVLSGAYENSPASTTVVEKGKSP